MSAVIIILFLLIAMKILLIIFLFFFIFYEFRCNLMDFFDLFLNFFNYSLK